MKHAELFAGYGGLGLAVEEVFGAELAWYAEFDAAPSKIMARHWPGVPNYGDVTAVDWSAVEPVDIISGGFPCQDVSMAGRRAGMNEGTRSNLWGAMRTAIETIRPTYVVAENVRGLLSATAHSASELEPDDRLLGDRPSVYLRALGRVLGDLADLGYDAEWRTIRASDVGAPHRRERVFILAWRRDATTTNSEGGRAGRGTHALGESEGGRQDAAPRVAGGASGGIGATEPVALLPTPVAQPSGNTPEEHLRKKPGRERVTDLAIMVENDLLSTGGRLLPTPSANLGSNGGSQHPDKRRAGGHSIQLHDAVEHLLPTVRATDGQKSGPNQRGSKGDLTIASAVTQHFGEYQPAITRWEDITSHPAPPPTELSARGSHRLSHWFTEWMQGVPPGWICATPGVSRNEAIKAAGNGVVPQQAAAALRQMNEHLPTPLRRGSSMPEGSI